MTLTQLTPLVGPMPSPALVASVAQEAMGTVVTLRGEADVFTLSFVVDVLAAAIADHDGAVIVDLTDTAFIDAGTARALARARQCLDDRGRRLTVRSPSETAARVLGLLGLSALIEPDCATTR
jgi:anti-anti-sigma factor